MSLLSHVIANIFHHIHNNFPVIPRENFLYPETIPVYTYKKYGFWEYKNGKATESELNKYILAALADETYIKNYEYLFSLLSTDYSKAKFIDVLTFRYMGSKYVNCFPHYMDTIIQYKGSPFQNNEIDVPLYEYNIEKNFNIPVNIKFIHQKNNAYLNLIFSFFPVSIPDPDMKFSVQEGDIVLDGGGFVGDTALLFAHYCKSTGHVYSFEFSPSSIQLFRQNLLLNPTLAKRITIIPQPLYENSNQQFNIDKENIKINAAATIFNNNEAHKSVKIRSISIDGFINQQKLDKVDYIKLVVENAELSALKGAEQTLRKFKPKLLIALYHKPEDLTEIPKFIHDLNLGYKIGFIQNAPELYAQYLYASVTP